MTTSLVDHRSNYVGIYGVEANQTHLNRPMVNLASRIDVVVDYFCQRLDNLPCIGKRAPMLDERPSGGIADAEMACSSAAMSMPRFHPLEQQLDLTSRSSNLIPKASPNKSRLTLHRLRRQSLRSRLSGTSITAVSYTHLDVYKRQL